MSAGRLPRAVDASLLARLGVSATAPQDEAQLYVRYLRALALLCECAPYVDEPDYVELIDAVLDDAQAHYPIDVCRDGPRRAVAPRNAFDD